MQTFLPYSDFQKSAKCLDYRRLGKQRVETKQILMTLLGESNGWANHPAVKMWRGHETALIHYGIEMCLEWISRGYKDTCLPWFYQKLEQIKFNRNLTGHPIPIWLGEEKFHASHRSNLLRKDPLWYNKFNWLEANNLPYIWPV